MSEMSLFQAYLSATRSIIDRIENTQTEAIERAAQMCAGAIAKGGLVHLFGSGHSRMAVEEVFPRYGSFPGFHPIVELSLTFHNQVVGANGQRQAMFIENVEGLGEVILRNFQFGPDDLFLVFSTTGVGGVVIDIALGAQRRGMPVIAITGAENSRGATPKHSSGKRLAEIADLVVDTCVPPGDAAVHVPNLRTPVGPTSTVANSVIVNMLKVRVAELLTEAGQPPLVLTSSHFVGPEESARLFEATYDDYRSRVRRL